MAGYQQVTLADLQARLAERVESKPWWTAEDARVALNEGLRVWNAATGFWTTKVFQTTVPNDPYVALPSTLVRGSRVLWNGIPLEKASLTDFDYGIPGWRSATTASSGHPSRPVYWAPAALTLLNIYPADAAGLNSIEVDSVRSTPVLTLPGDFVNLNQADLGRLLGYARHVLAFKVGGPALVTSYPDWLAFLRACGEQNAQFAASTFYRRALGLDQQYRQRRLRKPVPQPVDQALAADAESLPGGSS